MNTLKSATGGCCPPPPCSALHDLVREAGEEYYKKWPATGDRLAQPLAFQDAVFVAVKKAWIIGQNVSDQRPGDRDATKNKSSGIAGFAASDG